MIYKNVIGLDREIGNIHTVISDFLKSNVSLYKLRKTHMPLNELIDCMKYMYLLLIWIGTSEKSEISKIESLEKLFNIDNSLIVQEDINTGKKDFKFVIKIEFTSPYFSNFKNYNLKRTSYLELDNNDMDVQLLGCKIKGEPLELKSYFSYNEKGEWKANPDGTFSFDDGKFDYNPISRKFVWRNNYLNLYYDVDNVSSSNVTTTTGNNITPKKRKTKEEKENEFINKIINRIKEKMFGMSYIKNNFLLNIADGKETFEIDEESYDCVLIKQDILIDYFINTYNFIYALFKNISFDSFDSLIINYYRAHRVFEDAYDRFLYFLSRRDYIGTISDNVFKCNGNIGDSKKFISRFNGDDYSYYSIDANRYSTTNSSVITYYTPTYNYNYFYSPNFDLISNTNMGYSNYSNDMGSFYSLNLSHFTNEKEQKFLDKIQNDLHSLNNIVYKNYNIISELKKKEQEEKNNKNNKQQE